MMRLFIHPRSAFIGNSKSALRVSQGPTVPFCPRDFSFTACPPEDAWESVLNISCNFSDHLFQIFLSCQRKPFCATETALGVSFVGHLWSFAVIPEALVQGNHPGVEPLRRGSLSHQRSSRVAVCSLYTPKSEICSHTSIGASPCEMRSGVFRWQAPAARHDSSLSPWEGLMGTRC